MNLLPIILYLIGILGIIISLVLIIFAIKKNARSSLSLIFAVFLLSIFLMASGTGVIFLKNVKPIDGPEEDTLSSQPINQEIKVKEASFDDLKFQYKLASSGTGSSKNAKITIDNKSNSVFNGEIKLTFTDSSNQITNTIVLPIKNFMPSSSYSPTALVDNNAVNVDYSFSGTFNNDIDQSVPFTIEKITVGNNVFRFDVAVDDTSSQNLKNICDQFSNEYNSDLCNGFLIYFYPSSSSEKLNFNNAIADFYLDNTTKKSKFIIY